MTSIITISLLIKYYYCYIVSVYIMFSVTGYFFKGPEVSQNHVLAMRIKARFTRFSWISSRAFGRSKQKAYTDWQTAS